MSLPTNLSELVKRLEYYESRGMAFTREQREELEFLIPSLILRALNDIQSNQQVLSEQVHQIAKDVREHQTVLDSVLDLHSLSDESIQKIWDNIKGKIGEELEKNSRSSLPPT